MNLLKLICVGAVMMLAACGGGPDGPYFPTVSVPPPAPGMARIYFYRDLEPYESMARPWIYLNGAPAVLSEPGGVSYRDVPPNQYTVSVDSHGVYPNQFKSVMLRAGDTAYAKIESLRSWDEGLRWNLDTFVVVLMSPPQAQAELGTMRYVSGS